MNFIIPEPVATLNLKMSDGATVRVRRHGNADGPRIILSHGNGFAIDAYFPFWRLFLSDFDVIVYDQRNHGQNPFHPTGHTQQQMADDLEVILRAVENKFGERATIGAFHSLSTIVSLLHSPRYGMRWAALILFDPPLAPPAGHRLQKFARDFELSLRDWALRRQRKFKTSEELARHFQGARRMQRWAPGAADLMARSITRPSNESGVELVCPPEFEAAIYEQNSNSSAWSIVPSVAEEILVVCGDFNVADADPPSLVSQALHIEFGVSVVAVPDSGHLLQIERPREVERIVRDHLRSLGVAPQQSG